MEQAAVLEQAALASAVQLSVAEIPVFPPVPPNAPAAPPVDMPAAPPVDVATAPPVDVATVPPVDGAAGVPPVEAVEDPPVSEGDEVPPLPVVPAAPEPPEPDPPLDEPPWLVVSPPEPPDAPELPPAELFSAVLPDPQEMLIPSAVASTTPMKTMTRPPFGWRFPFPSGIAGVSVTVVRMSTPPRRLCERKRRRGELHNESLDRVFASSWTNCSHVFISGSLWSRTIESRSMKVRIAIFFEVPAGISTLTKHSPIHTPASLFLGAHLVVTLMNL